MKKFIGGFILGALIFGSIGVIAVSYIAIPVDFKVIVNGKEFTSDPPPLTVEGRTYLPLRAMGEALGVPVNWNEEMRQAEVGNNGESQDEYIEAEILTSIVDDCYIENSNIPNIGKVLGLTAYKKAIKGDNITYFYSADNTLYGNNFFLEIYKNMLTDNGFSCKIEGNTLTGIDIKNTSTVVGVENEGILVVGFKTK